jgi:hypothetical protein
VRNKKTGKMQEKRSYPIHDRSHAINALSRVSQHGSASEKARVKRAVYAKYPGLKPKKKKRRR